MPNGTKEVTGWVGWVYFAGILLILRGIADAFLGISALVNKHYLFVNSERVVVATSNTAAWGWVQLAVGLLVLAVGFSVLHGNTWARVVAVFMTGVAFLVNLAFISVFPLWSIIAMVVNVVVIYALIVHGDEARE